MRICRITFFICIFFLHVYDAASQKKDTIRFYPKPFQALKFSPLHLLSIYPSFLMGYERQIAKHQSLQADVGVVFQYFIYNPEFQDKRGVKLKGEYRYYLGQYDFRKVGAYLAAEAYWNIVNFNRETSQTECYDLNCQSMFRRTYFYKVKYREEGLALKYGLMINAGGFIFDFNAGIALRFVDYKKPNLPPNREVLFDGQFIQIPNETKRIAPGVALGVRIGHTIGRIRNQ